MPVSARRAPDVRSRTDLLRGAKAVPLCLWRSVAQAPVCFQPHGTLMSRSCQFDLCSLVVEEHDHVGAKLPLATSLCCPGSVRQRIAATAQRRHSRATAVCGYTPASLPSKDRQSTDTAVAACFYVTVCSTKSLQTSQTVCFDRLLRFMSKYCKTADMSKCWPQMPHEKN